MTRPNDQPRRTALLPHSPHSAFLLRTTGNIFQILAPDSRQLIGSKRRPVVNSQELNFPKSPPVTSGVVHALPLYARYKASEVQLLSRRWSSLHWPSALPLLRAGWCSCALYATIVTVCCASFIREQVMFFEAPPPSRVHAVTHHVSLKAFEALIPSRQWPM